LEDRIVPTVLDDAISKTIASLDSGPPLPIASSAMQQPQVHTLLESLAAQTQTNLKTGKYKQNIDLVHHVDTITVDPVHAQIGETADFNLPLGSFLTLSSPEKVNVQLEADFVLVVQVDLGTHEATVLDGNLAQVTGNGNLPASTMAIHMVATLPPNFAA